MSEFVEEFKIGNTNVKIADDYCRDKTPEDVNAILKRIGVNALPHFAMNKIRQGSNYERLFTK